MSKLFTTSDDIKKIINTHAKRNENIAYDIVEDKLSEIITEIETGKDYLNTSTHTIKHANKDIISAVVLELKLRGFKVLNFVFLEKSIYEIDFIIN